MLIDSDEMRAQALTESLARAGFAEVLHAREGANLSEAVERTKPDLIIIDMALPDRDALEDVRAVSADKPVVMFADSDDPSFVEDAIAAGVCSYNLSGIAFQDVKPIMASAVALFRRYRRVEDELAAAKNATGRAPRDRTGESHSDEAPEDDRTRGLSLAAEKGHGRKSQASSGRDAIRQRARHRVLAQGRRKGGRETIMSDIVSLSAARKTATPKMRIGLLHLTDGAPAMVAHEFGFFAEEGIETELFVEPSWANIADKLAFGFLDAAVVVPPLAFAVQMGLRGPVQPLLIPSAISSRGSTITLNNALAQRTQERAARDNLSTVEALAAVLRARPATLGIVHAYSTHNLYLRYWLATAGIEVGRDVKLMVVPPASCC